MSNDQSLIRVVRGSRPGLLDDAKQVPAWLHSLFPSALRRATLRSMSDSLVVNEIYLSLQGESTFAGLPCIFVRLTACDLRCSYCDTAYAFTQGKKWRVGAGVTRFRGFAGPVSSVPPCPPRFA